MIQTLDRLCGSTVNTYSFKSKITDFNDALDWYFSIAFDADGKWTFDDINKSSPPIDTQNIVSGTNRYKISSFTEKIINLIKLEVDNSSGTGLSLIPETIDDLEGSFDDVYINAISGTPTHYIKYGDYIYLRPKPNYDAADGLRAYFNRPASKFEFVSCSISNANPAVVTATAHGLSAGDTIIFETDGTLNTGLTADTQYYVLSTDLTADTFKFSATSGGTAVATSSTGSGCHFLKTSMEPGIVPIHHLFLVRRAALTNLSYINSPKLGYLPAMVAQDEKTIRDFFGSRTKDMRSRLTPTKENNK